MLVCLQDGLDSLEHTLLLNEVEEVLDHHVQTLNLVEVLLPDELGTENTVGDLLRVAGSPEVSQQLHNLLVVVGDDVDTVLTLATLVVGDDGSETEDETLRQLALALQIGLHAGQVAGLELGEGVEHDARHLVVDERVVEALQHVAGELLELVHREVERLHELLELHLVDVLRDDLVVAGIAHNVDAAEEGNGREHGVRAVEQGDLTLVVGLLRGNEQHVESGFVGGELGGYLLRGLDDPEVEVLGLYDEVVAIRDLLLNLGNLLAGEAGDNAVDECGIDAAGLLEPLLEAFAELPELNVLIDAVLQHVAVQEDELAGEDDEALRGVAVKGLIAAIEQLHELAGIGTGGSVLQLAGRIEGDAGLGGVGDDEADLGLVGQRQEGSILRVGVQRAADDVDTLEGVDGLAVLATLQVNVVETVLGVEPVDHTVLDGLYDDDRSVEVGLLVHVPDNPINECAEEVSLAELDDLLGHHTLRSKLLV